MNNALGQHSKLSRQLGSLSFAKRIERIERFLEHGQQALLECGAKLLNGSLQQHSRDSKSSGQVRVTGNTILRTRLPERLEVRLKEGAIETHRTVGSASERSPHIHMPSREAAIKKGAENILKRVQIGAQVES